jgi:integrase-like protein
VAQALGGSRQQRGSLPESITVDNGSEFCSRALEAWAMTNEVQLCFIRPGRRVENGFIESFNGRLRDECLNVEWFSSLEDARQKLAKFREHYNQQRPHSALADRTPAAFAALHRETASTLLGRALLRLHQEARECAKTASIQEKGSLPKISNLACDREWERFISTPVILSFVPKQGSGQCIVGLGAEVTWCHWLAYSARDLPLVSMKRSGTQEMPSISLDRRSWGWSSRPFLSRPNHGATVLLKNSRGS